MRPSPRPCSAGGNVSPRAATRTRPRSSAARVGSARSRSRSTGATNATRRGMRVFVQPSTREGTFFSPNARARGGERRHPRWRCPRPWTLPPRRSPVASRASRPWREARPTRVRRCAPWSASCSPRRCVVLSTFQMFFFFPLVFAQRTAWFRDVGRPEHVVVNEFLSSRRQDLVRLSDPLAPLARQGGVKHRENVIEEAGTHDRPTWVLSVRARAPPRALPPPRLFRFSSRLPRPRRTRRTPSDDD